MSVCKGNSNVRDLQSTVRGKSIVQNYIIYKMNMISFVGKVKL